MHAASFTQGTSKQIIAVLPKNENLYDFQQSIYELKILMIKLRQKSRDARANINSINTHDNSHATIIICIQKVYGSDLGKKFTGN